MFTLKMTRTGSDPHSASWIPGVVGVHRIGTCAVAERKTVWASYFKDHALADYAAWSDENASCALLCVATVDGARTYVVCGPAWLLGPAGDTIERIAP